MVSPSCAQWENRVCGFRRVGFVKSVVFGVDSVIDAIDEKINPIDEKFTSKKSLKEVASKHPLAQLARA
jgi:hypothetical protein